MARIVMTLLGLGFLALGIWLGIIWWDALRIALMALAIILALFIGVLLTILGFSEIAGSRASKSAAAPGTDGQNEA